MTIIPNPPHYTSKYYVDMEKWISRTDVQGSITDEHLTHPYKKAAVPCFNYQWRALIIIGL